MVGDGGVGNNLLDYIKNANRIILFHSKKRSKNICFAGYYSYKS